MHQCDPMANSIPTKPDHIHSSSCGTEGEMLTHLTNISTINFFIKKALQTDIKKRILIKYLKKHSMHYGTPNFSWAFRQLCKPKQSLNNFILVPMKDSTVLGTLQFAPDSFPELSNHQLKSLKVAKQRNTQDTYLATATTVLNCDKCYPKLGGGGGWLDWWWLWLWCWCWSWLLSWWRL